MPAPAEVARPVSADSTRSTATPRRASCQAAVAPTIPPPPPRPALLPRAQSVTAGSAAAQAPDSTAPAPNGRDGRWRALRGGLAVVAAERVLRLVLQAAGVAAGDALAPDAVGVDLLLADGLADLLLLGHGLGVQPDPLDRHGLLLHDRTLGVQHHLVLFLGDGRAVQGAADVGVGDGLAGDPDLLVRHGDGLGHVLADHVLAQPRPAGLALLGADVDALLGEGHGVVGGRAGGVVAPGAVPVGVVERAGGPGVTGRVGHPRAHAGVRRGLRSAGPGEVHVGVPTGGLPAQLAALTGAHGVVPVQLLLLLRGEVAVGVDLRGVLHGVLAHRYAQAVTREVGVPDRDERLLRAEQAGLHGDPLGVAGLVVQEHLGGRADLVAVRVDDVCADHAVEGVGADHGVRSSARGVMSLDSALPGVPSRKRSVHDRPDRG